MNEEQRIGENIKQIRRKISEAAVKSGRNPEDIIIVAVTKNIAPETMKFVLKENILIFAENKVQEFLKKYDILNKNIIWHFIGRLQTNKVKYIIDKVALIHSLDRMELAKEIDRQAREHGLIADGLVQVNISGEQSKAGVNEGDLFVFLTEVSKLPNIRVRGLMTMAPFDEEPEKSRWIFREMSKLAIDIKIKKFNNVTMDFLSMGMSGDFEVAVQEGANIVRLGSSIFD